MPTNVHGTPCQKPQNKIEVISIAMNYIMLPSTFSAHARAVEKGITRNETKLLLMPELRVMSHMLHCSALNTSFQKY